MSQRLGLVPSSSTNEKRLVSEAYAGAKLCSRGDIVLNRLKAHLGVFALSDYDGLVSPDYTVLRPISKDINASYFERLFKSAPIRSELRKRVKGLVEGFWRLYTDDFNAIKVPVPPLAEQAAIVKFLETVDRRVNQFVRAKRRLIELLADQKKAIITHAITRGLSPNAQFKPSGVAWLGGVPEHWEIKRLKHLARFESGESITGLSIDGTGDYPVYGGNGLRGYTGKFTHDGEYAIIGRQGALCGNVHIVSGKFYASEHAVVPTLRGAEVKWFGELIRAMNLRQYSQSAAQPGLSMEMVANLQAPVPPLAEQKAIVDAIEKQTTELVATIDSSSREIALIREYHTRLVSDVVTGKLDVCAVAATLPDEAAEPIESVANDEPDIEAKPGDEEAAAEGLEEVEA